jgi:hypothetical protein
MADMSPNECDQEERVRRLVSLAHQLTIAARDTYEFGTDRVVDAVRLRRFNELLHRVLGHAQSELAGDVERERREGIFEFTSAGLNEMGCPQLRSTLSKAV